jgi:crossover junction endodeoxyribonuclease RuvC
VRHHRSRGGADAFAGQLQLIFRGLTEQLQRCRPDCVAIESVFAASNARSALKLGHARGVAMLAATECGLPVFECAGRGQAVGGGVWPSRKARLQQMVTLLSGLMRCPGPRCGRRPGRGDLSPASAGAVDTLVSPPDGGWR